MAFKFHSLVVLCKHDRNFARKHSKKNKTLALATDSDFAEHTFLDLRLIALTLLKLCFTICLQDGQIVTLGITEISSIAICKYHTSLVRCCCVHIALKKTEN